MHATPTPARPAEPVLARDLRVGDDVLGYGIVTDLVGARSGDRQMVEARFAGTTRGARFAADALQYVR